MKLFRFVYFLAIIIFVSCDDSPEYTITAVRKVKQADYLADNNGTIFNLHTISSLVHGESSIIVTDSKNYNVYIIDSEFQIQRILNFQDTDYLFSGEIKHITKKNNHLFLVDEAWNIKIFDLKNSSLNYFSLHPQIMNQINNVSFINDSMFVIGGIISKAYNAPLDNEKITVGGIYNIDGTLINILKVEYGELNHKHPFPVDQSYVTYYKDNIYVCFTFSRRFLVYNEFGDLLKTYTKMEESPLIELGSQPYERLGMTIAEYPFHIENDVISLFEPRGNRDPVYINQYDLNFNLINRYKADYILPGTKYGLILHENYIIIGESNPFDRTSIYKFEIIRHGN